MKILYPLDHVKVDLAEMLGDAGAVSLGKPTVSFGEGFRIVSPPRPPNQIFVSWFHSYIVKKIFVELLHYNNNQLI